MCSGNDEVSYSNSVVPLSCVGVNCVDCSATTSPVSPFIVFTVRVYVLPWSKFVYSTGSTILPVDISFFVMFVAKRTPTHIINNNTTIKLPITKILPPNDSCCCFVIILF